MQKQTINIGLLSAEQISVDLLGEFLNNETQKLLIGNCSIKIENKQLAVSCGDVRFSAKSGLIFIPSNYETELFRINDVKIGIDFHWEQQKRLEYKGSLKFVINGEKIIAININNIEDYLVSVISSEMSPDNSIEFLKSHAIISRSWIISQLYASTQIKQQTFIDSDEEIMKWYDKEDHLLFDVCADDHCQRYQGRKKVKNIEIEKAVNETFGLVLNFEDRILDARYSKCCGGKTELFENVWQPVINRGISSVFDYKFAPDEYEGNLKTEKCAEMWFTEKPNSFCNTTDKLLLANILIDYDKDTIDFYRWEVEYSQQELSEILKSKLGIDFGEITDLIPIERGESGRLIKLKIVGNLKSVVVGKELEIRKSLSRTHLYSSAFFVEKGNIENGIPQKFILHGAGWGHGVGLCQIGAAVMAKQKYRFDEILLHYFPNATISRAY